MANYDNLCKLIAEKYPSDFARWLLNQEPQKIDAEILAGLKFDRDFIRRLFREDIMKESVIYQDILRQGEERGEKRGEKRGEERGEQKEALKYTKRLLNKRFGEIDPSIIERVQVLSTEKLEGLGEDILDFSSVSDLVAWLSQNTGS